MAEQQKQIARLIAKAWADESYKKRLFGYQNQASFPIRRTADCFRDNKPFRGGIANGKERSVPQPGAVSASPRPSSGD